jgi:hypothetical protein
VVRTSTTPGTITSVRCERACRRVVIGYTPPHPHQPGGAADGRAQR